MFGSTSYRIRGLPGLIAAVTGFNEDVLSLLFEYTFPFACTYAPWPLLHFVIDTLEQKRGIDLTLEQKGGIDSSSQALQTEICDLHVVSEEMVVALYELSADDGSHQRPSTILQGMQFKPDGGFGKPEILWSLRDELGGSIWANARIAGDADRYVAVVVVRPDDYYIAVLDPLTGKRRADWSLSRTLQGGYCEIFPGPRGSDELRIVVRESTQEHLISNDNYRRGRVVCMNLLTGQVVATHPFLTPKSKRDRLNPFLVAHLDRRGWLYVLLRTVAPGDRDDALEELEATDEIDQSLGGPLPRPGQWCLFCACGLQDLERGVWRLLNTLPERPGAPFMHQMVVDDSDLKDVHLYQLSALEHTTEKGGLVWSWSGCNATVPQELLPRHPGALTWPAPSCTECGDVFVFLQASPTDHRIYVVDHVWSKMYVLC